MKRGVQLRLIAQTQVLGLLQFYYDYILRKLNLNYGKGYQKMLIINTMGLFINPKQNYPSFESFDN